MILDLRTDAPQNEMFSRTAMLFGWDGIHRLSCAHVAVFGVGGVGGYAIEALARSGIGHLTIVDHDTVSVTNRNRQIIALESTIGQYKTAVMEQRLRDINPTIEVTVRTCFFTEETADTFDFSAYDYVIDCIDTVKSKLLLISCCQTAHAPLLACMGTGNKTDPTRLRIDDITKTAVCPLAKALRIACRKQGIHDYRVLWSDEIPLIPLPTDEAPAEGRRAIPASTAFVPPAAGLLLARTCVMDLLTTKN